MKSNWNNLFLRRGFTLIELMIVIVILGVLMGTILPRLTGAQARARDTGRIADIQNIAQALEVYYNDNGSYPGEEGLDGTPVCLDPDADPVNDITTALGEYLKGEVVPTPPSNTQVAGSDEAHCPGAYVYIPLTRNEVQHGAYALVSDVETWQMANADYDEIGTAADAYESISGRTETDFDAEDADGGAADSVHVYIP